QVHGRDDRAGGRGHVRGGASHPAEDAVTNVAEVGGPGSKIFVAGTVVAANLVIEDVGPSRIGGRPARDGEEGWVPERIVLQHGDLHFENRRTVGVTGSGQSTELHPNGGESGG